MPRSLRKLVLGLLVAAAPACAPSPASRAAFDAPDPTAKLYAIRRAGRQRDRSKIEPLIEALGSGDPAVRMMAITALERITGTRLGYSPYAPPPKRSAAIERWRKAAAEGRWAPETSS